MINKQSFKKAIEKAVKNGYVHPAFSRWVDRKNAKELTLMMLELNPYTFNVNDVIFSHDFARAFWGKKPLWNSQFTQAVHFKNKTLYLKSCEGEFETPLFIENWQYHLQRLSLEKEPLKYLEKFIETAKCGRIRE